MNLKIKNACVDDDAVRVWIGDGRCFVTPLWPVFQRLTPQERLRWTVVDDGYRVRWPGPGPSIDVRAFVWDDLLASAVAAFAHADGPRDARWNVLPAAQQELCALCWLHADLHNGGLLQFLGNWGLPVVRTAAGLERIHARPMVEAVRRSLRCLSASSALPNPSRWPMCRAA